ncbi:TPA: hypothetical protein ACNOH1_004048 [Providencia rettgeri]|uniref:Uncharacterized protein n=1 Tax=Providencia huaxiensis TaxID=2027290 RepID=A0A8I2AD95_9GAMM|nr:hypothetical protein [Providencia huaxiensis]MBQ0266770.1 hypothetical protein [Providencia huaxiensis]
MNNREINIELIHAISESFIHNVQCPIELHCNKTDYLDAVTLLKDSVSVDGCNELILLKLTNSDAASTNYFYGYNKRWNKLNDQYLNESNQHFYNFSHSYVLGETILFDLYTIISY